MCNRSAIRDAADEHAIVMSNGEMWSRDHFEDSDGFECRVCGMNHVGAEKHELNSKWVCDECYIAAMSDLVIA